MSRTVTLVAPNGAKVRTVNSKLLFVVAFGNLYSRYNRKTGDFEALVPPLPNAEVIKRTDSYTAALATLRKNPSAVVVRVTNSPKGEVAQVLISRDVVEHRARGEKQAKAHTFRSSVWSY